MKRLRKPKIQEVEGQASAKETEASIGEAKGAAERGNRRSEASRRYKNREQEVLNVVEKVGGNRGSQRVQQNRNRAKGLIGQETVEGEK